MLRSALLSGTADPGRPLHGGSLAWRFRSPVLCLVDHGTGDEEPVGSTKVAAVNLGGIDLVRYNGVGSHRVDRQLHHVRDEHADDFLITIPIDARIDFSRQGYSNGAEPGAFVVLSTATPFQGCISNIKTGGTFSALHMRISGSLLRGRVPHIDGCCDRPLALSRSTGNIMRGMFDLALEEAECLSATEAHGMTTMLADAVAMIINETPPPLSRMHKAYDSHASIHRRALAYIEENLCKQGLGAASIGEHCRVSERYIQLAFARRHTTVVAVVRDLRLERCRADLENALLRQKSVTQIAISWGFNDLAHFSRAFRRRFGHAPSTARA